MTNGCGEKVSPLCNKDTWEGWGYPLLAAMTHGGVGAHHRIRNNMADTVGNLECLHSAAMRESWGTV